MSCQLEPAIWSRDTGQRIPCFDRCQLVITWMSNTKEVHSKPRLHVSLSTCYLEYGSHLTWLHRHAYAPTSNTASHDNHEKINSWVSFCLPYEYGAPLGGPSGRRSSANIQGQMISRMRVLIIQAKWITNSKSLQIIMCWLNKLLKNQLSPVNLFKITEKMLKTV